MVFSYLHNKLYPKRLLLALLILAHAFFLPAQTRDRYTSLIKKDSFTLFKGSLFHKPAIQPVNGFASYALNYRSNIDTPYAEKDILQHNITGQFNALVAGALPVQVNYWLRQSNSHIFKNIADVQVLFSGAGFRSQLQTAMRNRLQALEPSLKDSLLETSFLLKQQQLLKIRDTLNTRFHPQKLTEAIEILKVPKITHDLHLPDSVNNRREDSIKRSAALFIDEYTRVKQRYEQVNREADSLKALYEKNCERIKKYRDMINSGFSGLAANGKKEHVAGAAADHFPLPGLWRWLMGVRNFSIGRSPVNYSELTARNVSVNGVNFEYNSWYYFAITAGLVNYRFRDFAMNGIKKVPQSLYMVRAGIGSLERNYFIVSAWRGQKQFFGNSTNGNNAVSVSGLSVEGKWSLNRSTWLTAEVARSSSPDISNTTSENNKRFSFDDKNNQAFALHLYSLLPVTGARVEAFYKKAGARFQSFSSFQTNAAQESWYVKAEQSLFGRRLRLSGSLRSNEFSNPLIIQNYKSNTIFKSVSASVRVRKWPVVTIGYQPMSQYTRAGDDVIENRFQSLNGTLYHGYRVKELRMATTAIVNKFFNSNSDTGFVYYNATNTYFMQSFFFTSFTANVGASFTKNAGYLLQVLDGYVEPGIGKRSSAGIGIRLYNMNHSMIRAGAYINANICIGKQDVVSFNYDHGYLPAVSGGLARSEMGTVQYTRTFNFK